MNITDPFHQFTHLFLDEVVPVTAAAHGGPGQVLVCEPLDLEELCRPEEGLQSVGLDVDLAAVDVAHEALHVRVRRVAQDDHRVRARILL